MDRCLQCTQQSPQLGPQSISGRPRTVKCSGCKAQSSKTSVTQPYLNQLPHKNGTCKKIHCCLWQYISAITYPHGYSLAYFQSESVWRHLPATHIMLFSEVGSLHGDPRNVYSSLPLFADNTSLEQGLTRKTSSTPSAPRTHAVLLPALHTTIAAQRSRGSILGFAII